MQGHHLQLNHGENVKIIHSSKHWSQNWPLAVTEAVCNLGVMIVDHLRFCDHVATVSLSSRLFAISNLRKTRPLNWQMLIQAMVISHIFNNYDGPTEAGPPNSTYVNNLAWAHATPRCCIIFQKLSVIIISEHLLDALLQHGKYKKRMIAGWLGGCCWLVRNDAHYNSIQIESYL